MTDKKEGSYEELVDPDVTGEAAERGDQPYVGQLGPDNAQEAVDAGYWEGMQERGVDEDPDNDEGLMSQPEK